MKKIFLTVFTIACFHIAGATNPVTNSSFESWSGGNPDGWTTSNYIGYWTPITQTSPGNTGSSAAKGQAANYSGYIYPPALTLSGLAVTQDYNNLEFFYKTSLQSGDIFIATAIIRDAGSTVIGEVIDTITTNASSFTMLDLNIPYTGSGAATAEIIFAIGSSSASPSVSSFFILDDVSLSGLATGIQEPVVVTGQLQVFPMPAHNLLTIKGQAGGSEPVQFTLVDAAGRTVIQKRAETSSGNFINAELNLQGIAPGVYSLVMVGEDKVFNQRIVVQ